MFDFSKLQSVADTLETATRDLDSRLEQITNLLVAMDKTLDRIETALAGFEVVLPDEVVTTIDQIADILDRIERNTRP